MRGNLREILSRADLRWVLDRLAQRIVAGRSVDTPLTLNNSSRQQRRAMDDLLGRKTSKGRTLSVDVARLCAVLDAESVEVIARECCAEAYAEAAARANRAGAWEAVFSKAKEEVQGSGPLFLWLEQVEREGLLKRLSGGEAAVAESLLERALAVLRLLPAERISLADLAASAVGDSHALDVGQPLATLCLRAIRVQHGIDGLASSAARRRAWAAAGVLLDDLSAPALVFNLSARPGSPLASLLDLHREASLPAWLSLRQVRSSAPDFEPLPAALDTIYVCENPSVVSRAAAELGAASRPLICTNGRPAAAVMLLLGLLRRAGARLLVHADLDWSGLRIVDQLITEFQAEPWQMTAEAYEAAPATVPLSGRVFDASWAGELARVMRERGQAVYEEQVCLELLESLRDGSRVLPPGAVQPGSVV